MKPFSENISAVRRLYEARGNPEIVRQVLAANSMCPGWVKTDMGGANAGRDVSQGADTAVWLALDAPRDLTGKFLRDRKVIAW